MAIFPYEGLTKTLEIGNTPIGILSNTWKLEQVRNTKFVTNISNEMLLNPAKCEVYSFHRFWVIKVKIARISKTTACAFHFLKIQSAFYQYLQSRLDFLK